MAVRKIKSSWWVDFRHEHVRYRKKSPDNSKAGAEAYEAVLRGKLARGELLAFDQSDNRQKEQEQKFKDFAWQWFETYVKSSNKHSEISKKKYILRAHLIPFFGELRLNQIGTQQVDQYKSRRIKAGLVNGTINNELLVLGTCIHTAQEWFGLEKIAKIKLLKYAPSKFDFLSREECYQLLAHSDGVWREIIFTALKTGLRLGELRALSWSDINWSNRTLTVRHSWCDYKKGLVTPKSNRERHIPLSNELHGMFAQKKQRTGFVFTTKKSQGFTKHWLNQKIADACKRAGMREITCHTLRHTFASHLAIAGVPLRAIQELLGHRDIQTTMRYAHLAPHSLRDAVSLLDTSEVTSENILGNPWATPGNSQAVSH